MRFFILSFALSFLFVSFVFAQVTPKILPFILPRPALPGPATSIFNNKLFSSRELPSVLNFKNRKSVMVFRDRFSGKIRELKIFALKSPFSFPRFQQNAAVIFSTLRGFSSAQVLLNMSIFCRGAAVYTGPFAEQIIIKLQDGSPDESQCLAILEYYEKKEGSGNTKTLKTDFVLPKL
ncbi:MAG: hypothetical protein AAB847_00500 [Patescibacteria group bacterium]